MKIIAALAVGLVGVLSAVPAQANTRSFVSGHGSDAAACTLAAPCRTFAAAYAVTVAGGEIDVLDPGGYGALTIFSAISIQGTVFQVFQQRAATRSPSMQAWTTKSICAAF